MGPDPAPAWPHGGPMVASLPQDLGPLHAQHTLQALASPCHHSSPTSFSSEVAQLKKVKGLP